MSGTSPPGGNTQGFPNNVIAFTNPASGQLTMAAYRFLLSIWQRTGGSGGGGGTTVIDGFSLMDDIGDAAELNAGVLLLMDSVDAPASEQANVAIMMDGADITGPTPNVVLAAEMATVQDAPKTYPGLWAMVITDEGP